MVSDRELLEAKLLEAKKAKAEKGKKGRKKKPILELRAPSQKSPKLVTTALTYVTPSIALSFADPSLADSLLHLRS